MGVLRTPTFWCLPTNQWLTLLSFVSVLVVAFFCCRTSKGLYRWQRKVAADCAGTNIVTRLRSRVLRNRFNCADEVINQLNQSSPTSTQPWRPSRAKNSRGERVGRARQPSLWGDPDCKSIRYVSIVYFPSALVFPTTVIKGAFKSRTLIFREAPQPYTSKYFRKTTFFVP